MDEQQSYHDKQSCWIQHSCRNFSKMIVKLVENMFSLKLTNDLNPPRFPSHNLGF